MQQEELLIIEPLSTHSLRLSNVEDGCDIVFRDCVAVVLCAYELIVLHAR